MLTYWSLAVDLAIALCLLGRQLHSAAAHVLRHGDRGHSALSTHPRRVAGQVFRLDGRSHVSHSRSWRWIKLGGGEHRQVGRKGEQTLSTLFQPDNSITSLINKYGSDQHCWSGYPAGRIRYLHHHLARVLLQGVRGLMQL